MVSNPVEGWARRRERWLLPGGYIAALALYYLTPWPALALLWLALIAALTWRSPRVALALLPLTFPFWYVPKRVYGPLSPEERGKSNSERGGWRGRGWRAWGQPR